MGHPEGQGEIQRFPNLQVFGPAGQKTDALASPTFAARRAAFSSIFGCRSTASTRPVLPTSPARAREK
jgi:hypothetical protein